MGHEDWVHSVAWQPPGSLQEGVPKQPLCVLSASMDRTMMLWRPDAATGALEIPQGLGLALEGVQTNDLYSVPEQFSVSTQFGLVRRHAQTT